MEGFLFHFFYGFIAASKWYSIFIYNVNAILCTQSVVSMEAGMTEMDSAGAKAQTHLRHRNQVEGYNLPFEVPRRTAGVGK
jgi:hypothetical protein